MNPFRETAARSDLGRQRRRNEDRYHAQAAPGLLLVADGLGGHNAGDVASTIAVTTCSETLAALGGAFNPEQLRLAVAEANAAIFAAASSTPRWSGMGTTLVAAALCQDRLAVAHVGDSRLYRLRDEQMVVLTRDHTVAQWRLDLGLCTPAEARASSGAHRLTRAIGMDTDCGAEVAACRCEPGDGFLLCSDGLNHELEDEVIAREWRNAMRRDDSADSLCRALIDKANQALNCNKGATIATSQSKV